MTMEHTEDNHLQEQPLITIEHETDDPTAEAVGEAPIITIERYNVEDERQLPPRGEKAQRPPNVEPPPPVVRERRRAPRRPLRRHTPIQLLL